MVASGVPSVSREFALAGIVVASLLVVFVGHALPMDGDDVVFWLVLSVGQ